MVAALVLCSVWAAATANGEVRPEDEALESLLELAAQDDSTPLVPPPEGIDSGATGRDSRYSTGELYLGAIMLMTAEGRFPLTVLTSDSEIDITLFPNTALESVQTFPAWNTDELLRPGPDELYPSLILTADGEWSPASWVSFRAFATSGEIRAGSTFAPEIDSSVVFLGTPPDEFWRQGFWLGDANVAFFATPLIVELGRKTVSIGEGLVYRDVGTGLFASYAHPFDDDLLTIDADLFVAGRSFDDLGTPSPMGKLALRYEWGFANLIEVYGAYYRDRNVGLDDVIAATRAETVLRGDFNTESCGSVAQIARITIDECRQISLNSILLDDIGDRAQLSYLGVSSVLQLDHLLLRMNAVASAGAYDFTATQGVRAETSSRVRLRGYAFDLDAYLSVTSTFGPGLLLFGFTGLDDDDVANLRYDAFIGIAPLWSYSTIFFASGVNQTFTAARTAAAGINGHGVFGGGPNLQWGPSPWFGKLSALFLFADEPIDESLGGGGRFYGVETN
ncbi:MAG: hypothetical protein AAF658_14300, partial [Myxococcota bacterium]